MNIYSKILFTTLPLVFVLLLSTVGIAYHFSRTALTELAETWLDTRLSEALRIAAGQNDMLHRYGLEAIPASLAKAKMDAATAMSSIQVGEIGYIFCVNRAGRIAVHPDPRMWGQDVSRMAWFRSLGTDRRRITYLTPDGKKNLAMVDYFAPWQWYVLASDPENEVYGVANRMKPYLMALGIGGFAVMAVVLMLLTRRFTEPLQLLTANAERIGKGDLDVRLVVRSRDEFSRLANVFNQMAAKLQDTLSALTNREAHYRSLIENSSDLIATLDRDGCVTYLSPSVERILGYPGKTFIGRPAFEFVNPEDLQSARRLFDMRLQFSQKGSPSQLRFPHRDGSWRTLEATSNNLLDHPAVRGLVVNARDITQRKAAEAALQRSHQELEDRVAERTTELFKANERLRQEIEERKQMSREKDRLQDQLLQAQKMEAIGTLAGGIAHDFNNLLMGIQGNVEMLEGHAGIHEACRERLGTIQECVNSGARLTQQLLGFARLGKYQVEPTDINRLVRKSVEMFGRTRQEMHVVTEFEATPWTVDVDRGQMEQVMLNLLINAWQAMPDGGTVRLKTANTVLDAASGRLNGGDPGPYVLIAVTDSGTGMDKDTMDRIFDPFFTTKGMGRGTGLGLASVYGIVRNHGGFIDLQSAKGQGTAFSVYLKASRASTVASPPAAATTRTGHETVLLVDDDSLIRDVGSSMLKSLGYDVLVAEGGRHATVIYREHGDRIGLVILDMIMPEMGGGKTYDQLKQIDPAVRVLLSSGYSLDGQASAIIDRGCNGFIQKPFNLQVLSTKLREILDDANHGV
jgi:PAS domain S-box-containing protein